MIHIQLKKKKFAEASTEVRLQGNELFNRRGHSKKIHLDILSLYTQSVAVAGNGSKEMTLALGNRSALLMHLRKYEECLVDIDRALDINSCSSDLRQKLLTRRAKCLNLMMDKNSGTDEPERPQPNPGFRDRITLRYNGQDVLTCRLKPDTNSRSDEQLESWMAPGGPSESIPCARDCVSLEYNEKYGRHLVATRDIEPGQVVAVEKSFVLFPQKSKMYLVCSHCLTFACNGLPCESCAEVIYCSERCRQEAWAQYHDVECVVLPIIMHYERVLHNVTTLQPLLVAVRLFIKSIKERGFDNVMRDVDEINSLHEKGQFLQGFFENGIFQSDRFKTIYNLSYDAYAENDIFNFPEFIENVVDLLANKTNILHSPNSSLSKAKKLLYKLKLIVDTNVCLYQGTNCNCECTIECEGICGELAIGDALSPFCFLQNHACNPNTSRLFIKNQQLVLYTCLPVKKGEQLCTNYGPAGPMLFTSKTERRSYLKDKFGFDCNCQVCEENWQSSDMATDRALWFSANRSKLLLEFERSGIPRESYFLFFKKVDLEFWLLKGLVSRRDVIEMIKIVYKNVTRYEAYFNAIVGITYIECYFKNLFGVKVLQVPSNC